jgi:hypothetical protein
MVVVGLAAMPTVLARVWAPMLASFAAAEDFAEDVGEVEGRLRQRMAATLEGAAAALAAVEARCSSEGGGGGGDGGGSAAAAASKDAQLAALNNLLKAENNRLRDQALQDATKIKQLQCSLAGGIGDGCRGEWAVCQDDGLVLEGL